MILGFSDWVLVEDKKECDGDSEMFKGYYVSLTDCANQCEGTASMFIFGTNDYEINRCNDNGCKCICETSAYGDGSCDQIHHNGFRLYRYVTKGNILVYNYL